MDHFLFRLTNILSIVEMFSVDYFCFDMEKNLLMMSTKYKLDLAFSAPSKGNIILVDAGTKMLIEFTLFG